jgi:hypothetical protein
MAPRAPRGTIDPAHNAYYGNVPSGLRLPENAIASGS